MTTALVGFVQALALTYRRKMAWRIAGMDGPPKQTQQMSDAV
jgi:hypothetical protein